jgi:serine/threonine protein kinase, bacterial
MLAAGSTDQTVLPFTGLNQPYGVAVGHDGSVYISDANTRKVLKLAPGSTSQTVLVSTGLNSPEGVAVDAAGSMYVTDSMRGRVVKFAAGWPRKGLRNAFD